VLAALGFAVAVGGTPAVFANARTLAVQRTLASVRIPVPAAGSVSLAVIELGVHALRGVKLPAHLKLEVANRKALGSAVTIVGVGGLSKAHFKGRLGHASGVYTVIVGTLRPLVSSPSAPTSDSEPNIVDLIFTGGRGLDPEGESRALYAVSLVGSIAWPETPCPDDDGGGAYGYPCCRPFSQYKENFVGMVAPHSDSETVPVTAIVLLLLMWPDVLKRPLIVIVPGLGFVPAVAS
jgi:hypothetical protein